MEEHRPQVPSFPRLVEVDAAGVSAFPRLLDDLFAQEVNAVRVRGLLTPAEAGRAVAVLEAGRFEAKADDAAAGTRVPRFGRPLDHDHVMVPRAATEADRVQHFGLPVQWSVPDLETYFRTAALYREASRALWAGVDCETRVRACLAAMAGRAVDPMRSAGGEAYIPSTLRRISAGGRIPPHFENHQLHFPACAELGATIDGRAVMSCFVQLALPAEGGRLVMHAMTLDDFDRSPTARAGEGALDVALARYAHGVVDLAPGDALVFDSGRFAHEVTRVDGPLPRWTLGGLFAQTRGGDRVVYWG